MEGRTGWRGADLAQQGDGVQEGELVLGQHTLPAFEVCLYAAEGDIPELGPADLQLGDHAEGPRRPPPELRAGQGGSVQLVY